MMRFTLRRNGHMATVRTVHHIKAADLAALLCRYGDVWDSYAPQVWEKPPTPGKDITRAQLDGLVRKALTAGGTGAYLSEDGWASDFNDAEAATIAAWAVEQISRLYPALSGDLVGFAEEYPYPTQDDAEED